jgi:hypothetical protein
MQQCDAHDRRLRGHAPSDHPNGRRSTTPAATFTRHHETVGDAGDADRTATERSHTCRRRRRRRAHRRNDDLCGRRLHGRGEIREAIPLDRNDMVATAPRRAEIAGDAVTSTRTARRDHVLSQRGTETHITSTHP